LNFSTRILVVVLFPGKDGNTGCVLPRSRVAHEAETRLAALTSKYEIVVVNDGSTDRTVSRMIDHFGFERIEITYEGHITTAPVRGFYEKRGGLPAGVTRWVLVDKENGGKADALNAGINASTCPFFVSMDADSLIDENALLEALGFRRHLAVVTDAGHDRSRRARRS
jgi:glycosyltransferase involved in cell wall biosynthesis